MKTGIIVLETQLNLKSPISSRSLWALVGLHMISQPWLSLGFRCRLCVWMFVLGWCIRNFLLTPVSDRFFHGSPSGISLSVVEFQITGCVPLSISRKCLRQSDCFHTVTNLYLVTVCPTSLGQQPFVTSHNIFWVTLFFFSWLRTLVQTTRSPPWRNANLPVNKKPLKMNQELCPLAKVCGLVKCRFYWCFFYP